MDNDIIIIGAGVSGLVAALQLESFGYSCAIYESDSKVGGRVQSENFDGHILDKGFQVLLNAYPLAKKYLDYSQLNLIKFDAGSYIYKNNRKECIGDPLRDKSLLFSTIFSDVGTLRDKYLIFKLNKSLKKTSIEQIFASEEVTTHAFLKKFGFSNTIIADFFKPFFSGIFLETELTTSSRMFQFIFKMFGEGEAVIPKNGIQEISNQLRSKLKKSKIHFNHKATQITHREVQFVDGSVRNFKFCIVATEASNLIPNLSNQPVEWKSTSTLYFEVAEDQVFNRKMIGLLANEEEALINSISFPYTEQSNKLLSVSVVKNQQLTEFELITQIKKELKDYFNITVIKYLKTFTIPKALPDLKNVIYEVPPSETQLTESIFLAGDTTLNGSLNAAMLSGELAAKAIHEKQTGTILK